MLTPAFAGELFGLGQPLDAARHFIILPDAIGHGRSSKPSDGLRTAFPKYSYDDMVVAQHRLLTEHLGVKRLRVVMGNSMGAAWRRGSSRRCTWVSPTSRKLMASLPVEMSGRNWTSEELIVDSIRNDLEWMPSGNYTKQLVSARVASVFALATNGGNQALRQGRADARQGRRAARRAAGGAVHRRRQRHAVPVGLVARLQSLGGAGEDPGRAAGHQLRR
ncbi:MAG: alpha/beta fold hydrolase [Rubrivivax sp.]